MYTKYKVFVAAIVLVSGVSVTGNAAPITVFSSDFDSALASEIIPGTAMLTGVQGFSGFGPAGNQFGGSFLRSETGNVVTLQLNSLPAHTSINLAFLFAAIDSLDGTGAFPQGDFFTVVVDNVTVFSESFANALPTQIQSYIPPAGVELARHLDLGFTGPGSFYTDSAYDLGADPVFSNIAHSAASLNIRFFIQGVGIQDLNDESWAMDNLRISLNQVPVPAAVWLFVSGLLGLIAVARGRAMPVYH